MCDHDAFAYSGQKCSAQSIMFAHSSWLKRGLISKFKDLSAKRTIEDLTVGPVLSWNNAQLKQALNDAMSLEGSQLLFGGEELQEKNTIPDVYGSFQPTCVKIKLDSIMASDVNFGVATQEVFGP